MKNVGILGVTGYAGQQLLWILKNHPNIKIEFIASHSYENQEFSSIYQNHSYEFDKTCISYVQVEENLNKIDLLFIALPHGKSFEITKKALNLGVKVIDLGADFRLNDHNIYEKWYESPCKGKSILGQAVYGLTELNRENIYNSNLVANPGCYPTASLLGIFPLLKNNLIDIDSIIIDAKSGVSGAGRSAIIPSLMCECSESIKAYSVGTHRHTPEIEQEASKITKKDVTITFTPHLIPMNRGILCVIYAKLKEDIREEKLKKIYLDEYQNDKFIRIKDTLPETRWVKGSNYCDISIRVDKRTKRVIVISAIDNLMKGAAGQAVQNMNVMFGFEETKSIDFTSIFP